MFTGIVTDVGRVKSERDTYGPLVKQLGLSAK